MRLCSKERLLQLEGNGSIRFEGGNLGDLILDNYRIGLTMKEFLQPNGTVDLTSREKPPFQSCDVTGKAFVPGDFLLGVTSTRLAVGANLFGSLHTRSKYARMGLKMLGSSNYVSPLTGHPTPVPLVFEIEFATCLKGLALGVAYCFMLLYEINPINDESGRKEDFHQRFPFA